MENKCHAYNPIYEVRKKNCGCSPDGPITIEEKILINEYCSLHDTYNFNCMECPVYIAQLKAAGQPIKSSKLQDNELNKLLADRFKEREQFEKNNKKNKDK